MSLNKKHKFDFLEASPVRYNSDNNCEFDRPYILDFSPIVNVYRPNSFEVLIKKNSVNSVVAPYTLLIQVALGYLDGDFSTISNGLGQQKFEEFVRHIFGSVQLIDNTAFFLHTQPKREYGLDPGWSSAMTQGQALSLWLRLKVFNGTFEDLDHIGPLLLNGMLMAVEDGGGLYQDRRTDELWLEEYPSIPVPHVLNGFIFALFGLLEYNRSLNFNNSDKNRAIELALIKTLSANIYRYDRFGWSSYDLTKRNFAPTLYHLIHIYTLKYLSVMLDNDRFSVEADKWRMGIKLNKYHVIDALRFVRAASRKVYITIIGRRW
jgi:hypothetical protein